ncbi:MAG: polyprenyl synthetase family protein [Myxococcales bacterium]
MSAPLPLALRDYARLAEPRLAAFLDEKGALLRPLEVDLSRAHAALREYVLRGGKRLRGALVLLGHEAAGGAPEDALPASLGIELLHAYLLIHDDFMDRDELRRGGPTLHVALALEPGASGHLAASLAILAGSLCEAWALELVLAAPVPAARALAAARHLSRALADVTVGQMLDLAAPLGPALSARGVLQIEELKTGSYTFELPLLVGALLAGASERVLAALRGYARPLGQAFQIADDLLGTFGAPEVTGKSSANDLREGKRTLLVARALAQASPADAAALREGLGRPGMTDKEAEELRDILRRCGAEAAARADAERLCAEALAALDGEALPAPVAAGLRGIAEYAVRRNQ